MISSSLKPEYQVFEMPPRLIPNPVRWENYAEALTYVPFGRYTFNTAVITLAVDHRSRAFLYDGGLRICTSARTRP